jgi:DNA-binding CsgD family transcriptional regulator
MSRMFPSGKAEGPGARAQALTLATLLAPARENAVAPPLRRELGASLAGLDPSWRSPPVEPPSDDKSRPLAAIQAALEPLLKVIAVPALVLSSEGGILLANDGAHLVLASDKGALPRAFVACVQDRGETPQRLPGWTFTSLGTRGDPIGFLAISHHRELEEPTIERRLSYATIRWRLTDRQAEVLALVARGLTNRIIADSLGVRQRTVEFHISRILDKAGAHSRSALIVGILESDGR